MAIYLALSRSSPLGSWGLLFTPQAMVIAQMILVAPIVAALSAVATASATLLLLNLLIGEHTSGRIR